MDIQKNTLEKGFINKLSLSIFAVIIFLSSFYSHLMYYYSTLLNNTEYVKNFHLVPFMLGGYSRNADLINFLLNIINSLRYFFIIYLATYFVFKYLAFKKDLTDTSVYIGRSILGWLGLVSILHVFLSTFIQVFRCHDTCLFRVGSNIIYEYFPLYLIAILLVLFLLRLLFQTLIQKTISLVVIKWFFITIFLIAFVVGWVIMPYTSRTEIDFGSVILKLPQFPLNHIDVKRL